LDRDSSGGGIAALGMVASERLPPCGMVTAGESPSGWAESAADEEPDPDEEPAADEEAGPDGEPDSGGGSDAEPVPFFAWTAVVAVDDAREERGAVSEVLAVFALASAAGFAPPVS